jgi:hypothetical protein
MKEGECGYNKYTKRYSEKHKETVFGAYTKLRKEAINLVISVRSSVRLPAWNNSATTEGILNKFGI